MRKHVAAAAAALLLGAASAAAQEGPRSTDLATPAGPVALSAPAAPSGAAAPSLHVTVQEIDAQLRASEAQREAGRRAMSQRGFLYTVAAVALGVIVASVLLN